MPRDSDSSNWLRTLVIACFVAFGSILIMFPAWLPRGEVKPYVSIEDGAVEILQVILLLASMAFCLAAGEHIGIFRPIYRMLGLGCLLAAMGESNDFLDYFLPFSSNWLFLPVIITILILGFQNLKEISRFIALASRHPSSGFISAALILVYVFGEFFGSNLFWEAVLEGEVPHQLPQICEAYIELLGCYLIFVGVIGFCLPSKRRPLDKGE